MDYLIILLYYVATGDHLVVMREHAALANNVWCPSLHLSLLYYLLGHEKPSPPPPLYDPPFPPKITKGHMLVNLHIKVSLFDECVRLH